MRINDYELSHLILRFEQEKDMKPMHCVQNLAALRDLVTARIERAMLFEACKRARTVINRINALVANPRYDWNADPEGLTRLFGETQEELNRVIANVGEHV